MTVRKILQYPDDEAKLRRKSSAVKKLDSETKKLIADLKDTLERHPGAGLAAPQIGVLKRVALVRFGQDQGEMQPPLALINPVILETGPVVKGFDGCLSWPDIVTWDSLRPTWLVFSALDEGGKPITQRVEGIDSIVVHHEIDHLDGVFFTDRLDKDAKLYIQTHDKDGKPKLISFDRVFPQG
jgi:peptide deformylase